MLRSRRFPRLALLMLVAPALAGAQRNVRAPNGLPVDGAMAVRTIPTGGLLHGPDGAALDRHGALYVANWDGGKGTTVVRVSPNGTATVFARGLRAPAGVAVGPDGDVYVSNYGDGTVGRLDAQGRERIVARGLGHPTGLAFDARGRLYVADFGNYDGTVVRRVENGTATVFATGFAAPIGLAFGRADTLYVASFGSGEIHRVAPDGRASVLARVPNAPRAMLQFLARDEAGRLYVPSYGHHRVYRVDPDGRISVVAGRGVPGDRDGVGADAELAGPNSIVRAPDRTIWITEYDRDRLRKLVVR